MFLSGFSLFLILNTFFISAKKGRKNKKTKKSVVSFLAIEKYHIYWVKLRGFSSWPAIVEGQDGALLFKVHFFGDYTTSVVSRSSFISGFREGFVAYENSKNANPKLAKAVKEASLVFLSNKFKSSCYICEKNLK